MIIAVNAVCCINMIVCCVACALACSSFRSNVKTIIDADGGKGGSPEIRLLYLRIGILNFFAVLFLLMSTPVFIVVAASSFLRHKLMWVNMILFANTPLPQIVVLRIFQPKRNAGASAKGTVTRQQYAPQTAKVAVTSSTAADSSDAAAVPDDAQP